MRKLFVLAIFLVLTVWLGWAIHIRLQEEGAGAERRSGREARAAPVEVEAVERGTIDEFRAFTGTLAANAEFVVAAKVGGLIEEISVDLSDSVFPRAGGGATRQCRVSAGADPG